MTALSRAGIALAVAAASWAPGCATTAVEEQGPPELAALADARQRWAEAGYDAYAMVLHRQCFCPPEYRGPYEVEVRGGEVVAVRDVATGDPVPAENARLFPSVEEIFDRIEAAIRRSVARLDVEYAERGWPIRVWIDEDERIADEEQGFQIDAVEPLEGR